MDKNSDQIYQLVKEALHTFALEISDKITLIEERLQVLEDKFDLQKVSNEKDAKILEKQKISSVSTSEKYKTSEKDQKELIKALEMIDKL